MTDERPPDAFDAPHPASAYLPSQPVVYRPDGVGQAPGPAYGQPGFPSPMAPVQWHFEPIECRAPDVTDQQRYAAAIAAEPHIMSVPAEPRPDSAYDPAYAGLSQDRFYQYKMWLQSPEGQHYSEWEQQARRLLDIIEPFNARWAAGWLSAELELIRPLHDWLQIFDSYTRQRLTYADHNPAARFALDTGQRDPVNPIPYDVLAERLHERDAFERRYEEDETFWTDTFGIPLGAGWQISWSPGENDPLLVAPYLRSIIDQVTNRLWAQAQLPAIPAVPAFAPPVRALPRSMTALMQQMIQAAGGEELPAVTLPEAFEPPPLPTPMPPGPARWARGQFLVGRAVVVSGRQQWAEGVAIAAGPTVLVQRYDGAVGYFPINDVRGAR